jgi:opacity protein-like surface antigen
MNVPTLRQLISGAILLLIVTTNARADNFLDLYGGTSSTDDSTADVVDGPKWAPGESSVDLDFDSDVTLGMRAGLWLDSYPNIGLAADISHFNADADNAEFSVVPISFLLMARMPCMVSAEFPSGRMQPYLALGPSLMAYDFELELNHDVGRKVEESSADFGFDLRGGLLWQVTDKIAVYTEYRYTHLKVDYDIDDEYWFVFMNTHELEVETDLDTHHILFGTSFRF